MQARQARKLKLKDRVVFYTTTGTVIERDYMSVKIRWEDGVFSVLRFEEMELVSLLDTIPAVG